MENPVSNLEQAIAFIQGLPDAPFAFAELPPGLDMRDVIEATRLLAGTKPQPPALILEAACRGWWDCLDVNGKRIATRGWDEIPEGWKDDYRRRMTAALIAAIGWP
jgi:hypothetical protein